MATDVAGRLAQIAARLPPFAQEVVTVAGKIVADAVLEEMTGDTGGDRALSGMAGGRYKLDVKLIPLGSPVGVRIMPANKQAGMWTILSSGTSAHMVAAKAGRGTSSRGRAMRIGGAWHAGPFHVRGAPGKGTWTRGKARGFDEAIAAIGRAFNEVVAGG